MSAGWPAGSSAGEPTGADDLRRSADTPTTVDARGDSRGSTPVDLFEFLRLLSVASYRGRLTRKQAALAQLVALDSDGTTGTGVVVRAEYVGLELGISVSQVWRQFKELREGGWFEQTSRPSRGSKPGQGRRARYRTTCPPLDLGLASLPVEVDATSNQVAEPGVDVRSDPANRVADSGAEPRHDQAEIVSHDRAGEARDDRSPEPGSCRSSDLDRVAVLGETCRIDHAHGRDSLPSDGPTSNGLPAPVVARGDQPQDRARETTETARDESIVAAAKAEAWRAVRGTP